MKSNYQAGKVAVMHRPQNITSFNTQAAAGKFSTARPSAAAISYPPIWAVGDAVHPTAIAVTQIQYLMYLASGSHSFSDSTPVRIGGFAFGGLAPVSQGIPTTWRDGNGVLQPAWNYTGGLFKSSLDAPLVYAAVELDFELTVDVANVELAFSLHDPNNTPPSDVVASREAIKFRATNSREHLNIKFRVDERSGSQFRLLPDTQYAVYVARTDAGSPANVTLGKYCQSVTSIGVA